MSMRSLLIVLFILTGSTGLASASWEGVFNFQQRLAQQGNPEAQFRLGDMYEQGLGVAQDEAQARHWFEKASEQGHPEANVRLMKLEARLLEAPQETQEQVRREEEARERARQEAAAREQAQREAEAQERVQREAQVREQARREAEARERAQREAQARERAEREAQAREQARRDAEAREQARAAAAATEAQSDAASSLPVPNQEQSTWSLDDPEPGQVAEAAGDRQERGFSTDPCASPAARFTSTCRDRR
ncbi:tetratricopeptide repeat protein [Thioalkalivibrio sulfidiphilus]|uniref:Sel1 domain protein repeat-containing protein n=1 Tax=Thioalkalivibrio sulfidiphilus (strain HL-EbGR7) TaxID=396588 RepID=B8GRF4_THISH|nr:SEL1-like repeat protein [Thioalkalivibrio sulfidiphilus]ACL72508.1 Sel1 domain protein repeat-containing protein [Thioalkalivibrio sulfidiphilus HL-EbGr7]